jgi:hypothetical protein
VKRLTDSLYTIWEILEDISLIVLLGPLLLVAWLMMKYSEGLEDGGGPGGP